MVWPADTIVLIAGGLESKRNFGRGNSFSLDFSFYRTWDLIRQSQLAIQPGAPAPVSEPGFSTTQKALDFSEHEATESGHTLRDLRHRYVERIENQVKKASTTAATGTDIEQLERGFAQECEEDVAALQQELRMEKRGALLSKDVLVTLIAATGSLALALFANQFHIPTVFTLAGGTANRRRNRQRARQVH
jgi:hypothetical protein